jgi:MFS family permease
VAVVTTATNAIGWTVSATAESTLISRLAREAAQEWVFGLQYMVFSAGIGLGALVAGLIVDTTRPASFQLVYLGDAASYLGYAALMLTMRGAGRAAQDDGDESAADTEGAHLRGMRAVWADRPMRRMVILCTIVATCSAGQIEAGFPAYATQVAQVGPRVLAAAYVANTFAIVVGQLLLLPHIVGHSRTRLVAFACAAWAACWVLVWAAGWSPATMTAAALVIGGFVVFSFGEIVASPVAPAIVNDLAPESLRGRYNAAFSLTFTVGTLLGPVLAGLLLGAGLAHWWAVAVVGGNLVGTGLSLRLRRLLTAEQDGRVVPAAVAA